MILDTRETGRETHLLSRYESNGDARGMYVIESGAVDCYQGGKLGYASTSTNQKNKKNAKLETWMFCADVIEKTVYFAML